MDPIFLADLSSQNNLISKELTDVFTKVLNSGRYILGEEVEKFESEFSTFTNANFSVGVSSGTAAIEIALQTLGIGPGDEVIIPALSFVATIKSVVGAGATPILVDVLPDTYLIDHSQIEKCITSKTKAIIPVHLHGLLCDLENINSIARSRNLFVIEDAAQAIGSFRGSIKPGFGLTNIACYSFYPGKNLGALGDAGGITFNDENLALTARKLRNWGGLEPYEHEIFGGNERIDELQAAFLRIKIRYLNNFILRRREIALQYNSILSGLGIKTPHSEDGHAYHVYAIQIKNRQGLINLAKKRNISFGIHYPKPLHLLEPYKYLGYSIGDFPTAEELTSKFVSLPIHEFIKEKDVIRVVSLIKDFMSNTNI